MIKGQFVYIGFMGLLIFSFFNSTWLTEVSADEIPIPREKPNRWGSIPVPEDRPDVSTIPPLNFDGGCGEQKPGEAAFLKEIIANFSGIVLDVSTYPLSIDGFEQFMKDSGVNGYPVRALVELPPADIDDEYERGRRKDALACGLRHLMPPRCRWYSAAALLLVMQSIESEVGLKVDKIRHWFRPNCYNRARGGASSSDHRHARAMDFDFEYAEDRRLAQEKLCQYFWKNKTINFQLGRGCKTLHIGLESPRGRRTWSYSSLFDASCKPQQAPTDSCLWRTGAFIDFSPRFQ